MDYQEFMRATSRTATPDWDFAPEDVKRRYRARWWCIEQMRDRSWFYHGDEIPAWVPASVMHSTALD